MMLRTKLKITKLSLIRTSPLNTATKLLNPITNSYSALCCITNWEKRSPRFECFCRRRSRGLQQTVTSSGKNLERQLKT